VPPSRHIHPSIFFKLIYVPPSRHIHLSTLCPVDIGAAFPLPSPFHVVNIPINSTVNLPMIFHPQPTLEEQDNFGPHLMSSIVANTQLLSSFGQACLLQDRS
jgi:hypothetical protein